MKRLTAYLFAGAVLLGSTAPVFAQRTELATKDATRWTQLSRQLVASLDSPIDQIKQGTLQHVNFFATYHKDQIDLSEALPKLIAIYETDANEGVRILALTSLHALGERSSMRYLSEVVQYEPSPRVRALTRAALADFIAKTQTM